MQIANIYPVANQKLYETENYVMILAHLANAGLYKSEIFDAGRDRYIIMDNGLYEGAQVSTSLGDLIRVAVRNKLHVDEFVVPDAVNNSNKTIKLFLDNLPKMRQFKFTYKFMAVAQATTYEELDTMITFYNNFADELPLTVGISKLTPLDRASEEAIEIYRKSRLPIHFLGIKKSFSELDNVADILRSCDTSQLAFIAKNQNLVGNIWTYERDGEDVNLEKDSFPEYDLTRYKQLELEAGEEHGVL